MLVDSHCHLNMLDLQSYQGDLQALIKAAEEHQVHYFLNVSTELGNIEQVVATANQFPNVFASVGIHPDEHQKEQINIEDFLELAKNSQVIAIGETGLDYYRSAETEDMTWQHDRFRDHIRLAKQLEKPLIIHTRAARADTLRILKEEQADTIGGVMHCFTEDWATAKAALDLGFYISMSGIVTFKNAKEVHEVAEKVPIDRLLIETDAPFLTPVPYRGKCPNEPKFVRYVAECVAQLKNRTYEKVAEITTHNFFELFKKAKKVS